MTPSERPPMQAGPQVWHGPAIAARQDWIENLTPADIAATEAAPAPLDAAGGKVG